MANQITVNSGTGNITVTTSRSVIGTVANVATANYANFAGEANTANSATTATTANTANTANLANTASNLNAASTANVVIGGGTSGYVLQTDGAGNLSWTAQTGGGGNGVPGGANTQVQFNDEGAFGGVANFTFDKTTEVLSATYLAGDGGNISNIQGANVSGEVAVANTVSNPNQSNITTVGTLGNLDVSGTITANLIQANTIEGNIALTQVDYIDFDTANGSPGFQTGRVYWDSAKGTLAVDMDGGGNITQQVGEDQYIYVKANATITSGQVAMFNGVQGDTILAAPANTASAGFLPRYVIGVAPANIASGSFGYIQSVGEIYNLQTNAFSAGSILYLQANSAGALTATEPTAPDPSIVVAACLTQSSTPSATNGRIQVRPDVGYYMDQLHDVSNATPSTGDVLVRNSSNVYVPGNTVPAWNVETANKANIAFDSNILTVDGISDYNKVITTHPDYGNYLFYTSESTILKNYENAPGFGVLKYETAFVEDTANSATLGAGGYVDWSAINNFDSANNYAVPTLYSIAVPTITSDLADVGSATWTSFALGGFQGSLALADGSGATKPQLVINMYNDQGIRFNRRNGNSNARTNVAADDYLATFEWLPAGLNGSGDVSYNSNASYISAKVDSGYTGANGETVPQGFEIGVVDSSDNYIAHSFYANGDVALSGNVSASQLDVSGNISAVVANKAEIEFVPNVAIFDNYNNYIKFSNSYPDYANFNFRSSELNLIKNYDSSGGYGIIQEEYAYVEESSGNVGVAGIRYTEAYDVLGAGDGAVPGAHSIVVPTFNSDLSTTSPATWAQWGVGYGGHPGVFTVSGADIGTQPVHRTIQYSPVGMRFDRRNGNGASRTFVSASDYVANIEWLPAGNSGGSASFFTQPSSTFGAKVDSAYTGGDGDPVPQGFEMNVVDDTGGRIDHSFYANGDVSFNALGTISGNGAGLTSLTGANVTGAVAFATTANSVALGNVSGAGNIASLNLDGNSANYLDGTGSWGPVSVTLSGDGGNISNIQGANVSGEVSFAATANAVAVANVSGIGNIATINLDGNVSNVLKGDGSFGSVPAGSTIENGTSNAYFTGPGGDLSIKIDGAVKSQFGPDGLKLLGANTGPSDISRLDITNGGLQWILDNTQFSGGTPFGMNQYNNTSALSYGLNFYRARGSFASQSDVQSGDQGYTRSTQFRYSSSTVQSQTELVAVRSFSGSQVAVTHAFSADSDVANSVFSVSYGEAQFSNDVTANGNISGNNVTATNFVVLANATVADLTSNTPVIVGVGGAMIAVSDQDYQPASWSVTDNVWKYVSNRANV